MRYEIKQQIQKLVCKVNAISMSTALLSSFEIKKNYDWEKCAKKSHTCTHMVLTNDVSPRNSQDDKTLPNHIKINSKVNPFSKNLM